jgi:hypothetical protein
MVKPGSDNGQYGAHGKVDGSDNPRLSLPWVMSRIGGYRQVGVPITEIGAVFSAILLIFLQFYSTILSVEVTRL